MGMHPLQSAVSKPSCELLIYQSQRMGMGEKHGESRKNRVAGTEATRTAVEGKVGI